MTPTEIARIIRETGLGVGAFVLCAWMVVYIVKRMGTSLDRLIARLETFCANVKNEHANSQKEHEALMKHHDEMIKTLGRINGYRNDNA